MALFCARSFVSAAGSLDRITADLLGRTDDLLRPPPADSSRLEDSPRARTPGFPESRRGRGSVSGAAAGSLEGRSAPQQGGCFREASLMTTQDVRRRHRPAPIGLTTCAETVSCSLRVGPRPSARSEPVSDDGEATLAATGCFTKQAPVKVHKCPRKTPHK